ncbi:hypothetical protein QBC34DRAFT_440850 [Podospora aff. communis PSN243]|uniref:Reverse transcriptase n=1 Tax=Podospora aff. communis PSN243 TaxID=3040156 RepID=A0AAV9GDN8_9PEZI|nr:hypothetical protein QBC34DRAFT_440850 [Podospora aff. communis PSN243]
MHGMRPKIVAILEEWGPTSLSYYDGLRRDESKALFRMRANRIGAGAIVSKFDKNVSSMCPCGTGQHTIEHLLVYCPNLAAERNKLYRSLFHSSFQLMLAKDAKVTVPWALQHLKLDDFSRRPVAHPEKAGPRKGFDSLFEGT